MLFSYFFSFCHIILADCHCKRVRTTSRRHTTSSPRHTLLLLLMMLDAMMLYWLLLLLFDYAWLRHDIAAFAEWHTLIFAAFFDFTATSRRQSRTACYECHTGHEVYPPVVTLHIDADFRRFFFFDGHMPAMLTLLLLYTTMLIRITAGTAPLRCYGYITSATQYRRYTSRQRYSRRHYAMLIFRFVTMLIFTLLPLMLIFAFLSITPRLITCPSTTTAASRLPTTNNSVAAMLAFWLLSCRLFSEAADYTLLITPLRCCHADTIFRWYAYAVSILMIDVFFHFRRHISSPVCCCWYFFAMLFAIIVDIDAAIFFIATLPLIVSPFRHAMITPMPRCQIHAFSPCRRFSSPAFAAFRYFSRYAHAPQHHQYHVHVAISLLRHYAFAYAWVSCCFLSLFSYHHHGTANTTSLLLPVDIDDMLLILHAFASCCWFSLLLMLLLCCTAYRTAFRCRIRQISRRHAAFDIFATCHAW